MNDHWDTLGRFQLEVRGDPDQEPGGHRLQRGELPFECRPTALGTIPGPSVERLEAIGRWMAANGRPSTGRRLHPWQRHPGDAARKRSLPRVQRGSIFMSSNGHETEPRVSGLGTVPRQASMLGSGLRPLKMRCEPATPWCCGFLPVRLTLSMRWSCWTSATSPSLFFRRGNVCPSVFLDTTEVTYGDNDLPVLRSVTLWTAHSHHPVRPGSAGPCALRIPQRCEPDAFTTGTGSPQSPKGLDRAVPEPAVKISALIQDSGTFTTRILGQSS